MRLTRLLRRQINVKNLIRQIYDEGPDYGFRNSPQEVKDKSKTVIVEYSSPNICKPFHAGHLRSTILGHFVANLYEKLGWNVVRLNYLGDWGFQFGLLAVGFKRYGSETALAENPLHHLLEVYVKINHDNSKEKAKQVEDTFKAALEAFQKMENGDEEYLQLWKRFKDISMEEYAKMYQRLGVHFTENHFESTYAKPSIEIVKQLEHEGKVETDNLGRKVIHKQLEKPIGKAYAVLQKSDGTTLYLTRDVAALIDRYERFKFDRIHYVVEKSQEVHFEDIQSVMKQIPSWEERLDDKMHVSFGKIGGISTRQGNVIFLSELLDKAKGFCMETLSSKSTTRVSEAEIDSIAEELARSVIIIQDFSKQRLRFYSFNWNRMLYYGEDSGVFIQYCHSRLCSLVENALQMEKSLDFEEEAIRTDKNAMALMDKLRKFPKGIELAATTLEPHHVVQHILGICHASNKAYRTCFVRHENPEYAQAYFHMFKASQIVLANGMRLLGLKPLERM